MEELCAFDGVLHGGQRYLCGATVDDLDEVPAAHAFGAGTLQPAINSSAWQVLR